MNTICSVVRVLAKAEMSVERLEKFCCSSVNSSTTVSVCRWGKAETSTAAASPGQHLYGHRLKWVNVLRWYVLRFKLVVILQVRPPFFTLAGANSQCKNLLPAKLPGHHLRPLAVHLTTRLQAFTQGKVGENAVEVVGVKWRRSAITIITATTKAQLVEGVGRADAEKADAEQSGGDGGRKALLRDCELQSTITIIIIINNTTTRKLFAAVHRGPVFRLNSARQQTALTHRNLGQKVWFCVGGGSGGGGKGGGHFAQTPSQRGLTLSQLITGGLRSIARITLQRPATVGTADGGGGGRGNNKTAEEHLHFADIGQHCRVQQLGEVGVPEDGFHRSQFQYFSYDLLAGFLVRMNLLDEHLGLVLWPAMLIMAFLHLHTFHLVLYVWIAQQKAEHKTLEKLISSQSRTRIFRTQLAISTQIYAHLHRRLVRSIITCNREYISPLLLLYLLTMSPLNVHSIAVIGLKKAVPFQVKALLVVNTSLQIVNALLAFWPLLRVVGPVNGTAHRYFYRVQPHLKENDLSRLKLKVMTYHDVLTCAGGEKRAVAFTVGPLGPLTPNAVVEFLLLWSALLLFAFELLLAESQCSLCLNNQLKAALRNLNLLSNIIISSSSPCAVQHLHLWPVFSVNTAHNVPTSTDDDVRRKAARFCGGGGGGSCSKGGGHLGQAPPQRRLKLPQLIGSVLFHILRIGQLAQRPATVGTADGGRGVEEEHHSLDGGQHCRVEELAKVEGVQVGGQRGQRGGALGVAAQH
ncbi:hypothetical protein TYRP_019511 [Tyrophagus putrescentiae]|nr:hypothetical protein TYRP_019511 [Tyrophagus putrescentiae]